MENKTQQLKRVSTFTNPELMSTGLRKLTRNRKIYPFIYGELYPQKKDSCCSIM